MRRFGRSGFTGPEMLAAMHILDAFDVHLDVFTCSDMLPPFVTAMPLPRLLLSAHWLRQAMCCRADSQAPFRLHTGSLPVIQTCKPSCIDMVLLRSVPWLNWTTAEDSVAISQSVAVQISISCRMPVRWRLEWGTVPQVGSLLLRSSGQLERSGAEVVD